MSIKNKKERKERDRFSVFRFFPLLLSFFYYLSSPRHRGAGKPVRFIQTKIALLCLSLSAFRTLRAVRKSRDYCGRFRSADGVRRVELAVAAARKNSRLAELIHRFACIAGRRYVREFS